MSFWAQVKRVIYVEISLLTESVWTEACSQFFLTCTPATSMHGIECTNRGVHAVAVRMHLSWFSSWLCVRCNGMQKNDLYPSVKNHGGSLTPCRSFQTLQLWVLLSPLTRPREKVEMAAIRANFPQSKSWGLDTSQRCSSPWGQKTHTISPLWQMETGQPGPQQCCQNCAGIA